MSCSHPHGHDQSPMSSPPSVWSVERPGRKAKVQSAEYLGPEGKQVMGLGTHRWWPWLLWLALNLTLKPQDVKFPNLLCKLPFKIIGHLLTKNREEKNQDCNPLLVFCSKKSPALLRTPKHNTTSPVCFLFSSSPSSPCLPLDVGFLPWTTQNASSLS